jgi:hypothetical protein
MPSSTCWKIPFLGREEAAADQFSAYILLRFAKDDAMRLILGVAYLGSKQAHAQWKTQLSCPNLQESTNFRPNAISTCCACLWCGSKLARRRGQGLTPSGSAGQDLAVRVSTVPICFPYAHWSLYRRRAYGTGQTKKFAGVRTGVRLPEWARRAPYGTALGKKCQLPALAAACAVPTSGFLD